MNPCNWSLSEWGMASAAVLSFLAGVSKIVIDFYAAVASIHHNTAVTVATARLAAVKASAVPSLAQEAQALSSVLEEGK